MSVRAGIRPQKGQRDKFTREPPCLQQSFLGVPVCTKPSLAPLVSFKGLPLPTVHLNDARLGASVDEEVGVMRSVHERICLYASRDSFTSLNEPTLDLTLAVSLINKLLILNS